MMVHHVVLSVHLPRQATIVKNFISCYSAGTTPIKWNDHWTKIYAYRFRVQTVGQIGRNASLITVIEINKNKQYEYNTTYDGIYLEDAYGSYKKD